jgi:hypothetical protein
VFISRQSIIRISGNLFQREDRSYAHLWVVAAQLVNSLRVAISELTGSGLTIIDNSDYNRGNCCYKNIDQGEESGGER